MKRDAAGVFEVSDPGKLPASPGLVLDALMPLLTEERKQRIASVVGSRTRDVVAVLDGVHDPHNVAAVLRSSEAFGVQELHLLAGPDTFLAAQSVARGSERWVDVVRHHSPNACVQALHARGHRVYVAAMDGAILPTDLATETRVAIVFGNEHAGVSPEMTALADGTYTIPMCGFVQSLNVSVAAAITLFSATRGRSGSLDAAEREALSARYVFASVPRAAEVVAEYLRRRGA